MLSFNYHYVCGCGCGILSEPLKKEQYRRLLNMSWYVEKCAKREQKEPIFNLMNGVVVAKSEF